MSKSLRIIVAVIVLGLLLVTQAGCLLVAAAAGTGATVAYVRGDLDTTLDASPKRVIEATEKAFKDLDMAVISRESSGLDGKIIARTARDVKMTVVAKGQSENVTSVSIRAGVFGDGSMQERVLEKIRQNLGLVASAPTTAPSTQPTGMANSM